MTLQKALKDAGIDGRANIYNRIYQILTFADHNDIVAQRYNDLEDIFNATDESEKNMGLSILKKLKHPLF